MFLLQNRGKNLFGSIRGPKKWLLNTALFVFSPLVPLATILGFVLSWKLGDIKNEVEGLKSIEIEILNVSPFLDQLSFCLQAGDDNQWHDGVSILCPPDVPVLPDWSPARPLGGEPAVLRHRRELH